MEVDLRKTFGAEVKRLRTTLELSQEQLAERANLHRTYISDVEAGKRNPSLASIQRLARALGAPLSAVFCAAEEVNSSPARRDSGAGMPDRVVDILLAEPDPKAAELTLQVFKSARLTNRVHVVADGEAALDFLFGRGAYTRRKGKQQPQIVLLDFELPRISGMDVLRRLKTDPRTQSIPVVVLTGLRKDPRCKEAAKLGAEECIVKPVDFQSFSRIMPKFSFGWTLLKPEMRIFL